MKLNTNLRTHIVRVCSTIITIFSFFFVMFVPGNANSQKQVDEFYGRDAQAILPGAEYVKQQPGVSFPEFVRFSPGSEIPVDNFFEWLRSAGRSEEVPEFQFLDGSIDERGIEHLRYVQSYQGVPVDQTHFVVHVKSGNVFSFNGHTKKLILPQTKPVFNEDQALQLALAFVGAEKYMWEDSFWEADLKERKNDPARTYYPDGKLVITTIRNSIDGSRFAYVFDISALSPMKEVRVCVDAINGAILYDVPMESNCEAATVNTIFNGNRSISTELYTSDDYRLRDDYTNDVIHVRDWNSVDLTPNPTEIENTTNTWTTMNEIFGGTTLWCTKSAYNYFFNVHSRDSYDDADGDVSALINALFDCSPPPMCISANNASMSFSGGNMKVGLSSAGVLTNSYATVDIIGHEYAHAVTGSSAGLVYEEEWGALNESFSDIFGEAIENYTLGSNDWLMGSERDNGAIRSLSNPNAGGDPDTYLGTNWVTIVPPCDGSNDECGVHTNSGVQNFWFYLLTVGGTGTNDNGDDYEVDGIGLDDAEAIAYRNLVVYLGANSDYSDARAGSIQASIDLFGLCSAQTKAVMDAWYAVGVGDPFLNVTAEVTSDYNGADISCFGAADGEATATAFNGTPPYIFAWSDGQTGDVASGLSAGTYTVTVTDSDSCNATASVTLVEPPPLEIEAGPNQTIIFWDISMACATLTASGAAGGVPPYTYEWSSGGTALVEEVCLDVQEDTITIVTYYITITDANGCTEVDSLDVCYVDINCGKGGSTKVSICHYPPENPTNPQTVCVSLNSLLEHLAHGDDLASCDFVSPCDETMPRIDLPDLSVLVSEGLEGEPLLEAFPNPFSDQTIVRFIVHENVFTEVKLFDMHGKLIKTIHSGMAEAGKINDVELLQGEIPAGTYILQMSSGDQRAPITRILFVQ